MTKLIKQLLINKNFFVQNWWHFVFNIIWSFWWFSISVFYPPTSLEYSQLLLASSLKREDFMSAQRCPVQAVLYKKKTGLNSCRCEEVEEKTEYFSSSSRLSQYEFFFLYIYCQDCIYQRDEFGYHSKHWPNCHWLCFSPTNIQFTHLSPRHRQHCFLPQLAYSFFRPSQTI